MEKDKDTKETELKIVEKTNIFNQDQLIETNETNSIINKIKNKKTIPDSNCDCNLKNCKKKFNGFILF